MIRFLLLFLSLLLYSCGPTVSTEYRSAKTYISQNNYAQAKSTAEIGINENPNDALLAYFLALNVYGAPNSPLKNYSQAGKYFDLAIKMDDRTEEDQLLAQPEFIYNKDSKRVEIKTVREAVAHYRYVIWIELYNNSIKFYNEGAFDKAIENLKTAALIDPNNSQTYNILAIRFFESEDFDASMENANKGLKIDQTLTTLLNLKGQISMKKGDNIKAEEYFEQAYKTATLNNESMDRMKNHRAQLFDIYYTNKSYKKAIELNEELIANDLENVVLYSNAGSLYQEILLNEQSYASGMFSMIATLSKEELELLIFVYEDCIDYANQARTQFIMCNQLELDQDEATSYLKEAKQLKQTINDLRSQIKKINQRIEEIKAQESSD